MKCVAMIPARLHSTRLQQKLLQRVGNYSILQYTYLNAKKCTSLNDVIAVCDSDVLAQEIINIGGKALLSTQEYETGTDRIAEFAASTDADIIINIQGDEPQVETSIIDNLITALQQNQTAMVATPIFAITYEQAKNPNNVKVICDNANFIKLFTRACVPFIRDENVDVYYWKHVGIYAFRKSALINFTQLPIPEIEKVEKLENLRFIYHNIPVIAVPIKVHPQGIDTAEDLAAFAARMQNV